jgi:hypothetical protein
VGVELVGAIGVDADEISIAIEGFVPILPFEFGVRDIHGDIVSESSCRAIEEHFFQDAFAVVFGIVQGSFFVGQVDVVELIWELQPVVTDFHTALVDAVLVASSGILFDEFDVVVFGLGIVFGEEIGFGGHEVGVLIEGAAGPVFTGLVVFLSGLAEEFFAVRTLRADSSLVELVGFFEGGSGKILVDCAFA